jgi:DNA ligase (NAD+)
VGETTAKTLARAVSDIRDLKNYTEDQLKQMDDVGVKVAKSISDFFSTPANIELVEKLSALGLQLKNEKKQLSNTGNLNGLTFLFTGTLSKLKRSDGEAMVEANGGKLLSGVSSKLSFLVVGEDAGSKLEKAKKLGSVKIINEEEFLKMLSS